jgi:hypothetical protein
VTSRGQLQKRRITRCAFPRHFRASETLFETLFQLPDGL